MAKNIYAPFGMEAEEVLSLYEIFLKTAGVTTDTRTLTGGEMFFALKGENFDGNKYALQALEKGAAYAVVDKGSEASASGDARVICVDNTLLALKAMARCHREHLKVNGRRLPVVGLTGTNGKTPTKELIRCVLASKFRVSATKGNLKNMLENGGLPVQTFLKKVLDTGRNLRYRYTGNESGATTEIVFTTDDLQKILH